MMNEEMKTKAVNAEIKGRTFICPEFNLETETIINLLEKNREAVLVTNRSRWRMLERELEEFIASMTMPEGLKLSSFGSWNEGDGYKWGKKEEGTYEDFLDSKNAVDDFKPSDAVIYGVKLGDDAPEKCESLHGDSETSVLEKVAEIIGTKLSTREQFVAANARGYIPEMTVLAKKLGLSDAGIEEIVSEIRLADRKAQGICSEEESKAECAIRSAKEFGTTLFVRYDGLRPLPVVDRLFGKEFLVYCAPDMSFYSHKPRDPKFFEYHGSRAREFFEAFGGVIDEGNIWKISEEDLKEKGFSVKEVLKFLSK
jgi:hypothetical protein